MIINVVTLTGRRITFEIDGSHTLRDLKHAVQDAEGLPPDQQRFIYAGVVLLHGLLEDQIEKIQLQYKQIRLYPSIDIALILRLTGGGNQIYPRTTLRDNEDQSSGDDELPPNQVHLKPVKIERASSSSSSQSFDPKQEKGDDDHEPHQILSDSSNHQSCVSQLDHNQNALYYQGIDQLIQGMNSLRLFKSQVDVAKRKNGEEPASEKIAELNRKISTMEGVIANLGALAKQAEDRGYKKGCEVAWTAMRELIVRERPEWDLSFLD
ncbi:hypothetical protein Sjap_022956 [Stephania japonica]|uniref:Ubiquitin-like domain-containing protein n=1 Tax=Stephania japonica TaxID=461633 RepID=A0AAP0EQB3_9MAGN